MKRSAPSESVVNADVAHGESYVLLARAALNGTECYDQRLFTSHIDESLECTICKNVMRNVAVISQNTDNHEDPWCARAYAYVHAQLPQIFLVPQDRYLSCMIELKPIAISKIENC